MHEPTDSTLSAALDRLLDELGCSQRAFASSVHLDHSAVSRYRRGERLPPWTFVEVLLKRVELVRGEPVHAEKRQRIKDLYWQASEEAGAWGALAQMERRARQAADDRAERAESKSQALEAFYRARDDGPNWSAFNERLRSHGWPPSHLQRANLVSSRVMACLSDPTSEVPCRTTGVVIAPPQSGKTTLGVGIVARALDIGYRLVIVLHGPYNSLRSQMQVRLEEGLGAGAAPSRHVHGYPAVFLTDRNSDYSPAHTPAPFWRFEKADAGLPLFAPVNLATALPRLAVVKQNVVILKRLLRDLHQFEGELADVPALLVDLEPLRASPLKAAMGLGLYSLKDQLVELLPRAQLVRFEERMPFAGGESSSLWGGPPDYVLSSHPRGLQFNPPDNA